MDRKTEAGFAAVELEADRGYDVVRRQDSDAAPVEVDVVAHRKRRISQARRSLAWYFGEVRPDFPVENMFLENFARSLRAMHRHRHITHGSDGIHEKRQ